MMTFWIFSDLRFLSFPFYLGLAPFPHTFRVRWVSVPNRNVWPRNKEKNRKKGKEAAEVATTATAPATYILFLFFLGLFWTHLVRVLQTFRVSFCYRSRLSNARQLFIRQSPLPDPIPTPIPCFWGIWNWLIQHDKYFQIPFNFFDILKLPLSPWSIVVR